MPSRTAASDRSRRLWFGWPMAAILPRSMTFRATIHELDAERLLEDVIERARARFWRPLGCNAKEESLLALATVAGGVPAEALEEAARLERS